MALARYDGLAPIAGSTITVRLHAVITLATIYADLLGTPLANPFSADSLTGLYAFYADDGATYDITLNGNAPPTDRVPDVPSVLASGISPARTVSLVVDDEGVQVILAQVTH